MWADEMSAENAPGPFFHQGLVSVDGLGDPARRVPGRGLLALAAELEARRAGFGLAHAHRGDRRQCERDARHASIIGPVLVAFEKIGCDDPAIMARYRGQRRTLCGGVALRIDDRV